MRTRAVSILAMVAWSLAGAATASADPAITGYPGSIAATGDSITQAYDADSLFPPGVRPQYSWATGSSSKVNSLYLRILAANPAIAGHAFNDAKSGARMVDLNGQLGTAAGQSVDYVTILMGGNDVCQPSEAAMTSVADFTAQYSNAMATLTAASPSTNVYVVSIPNVKTLWSTLKGNAIARFVWAIGGVCQSMLARPLSTAQTDVDRRARVLQREVDFNAALASVCAAYTQCRFDGNAVFNVAFVASDISTRDYFHPSISGQKKLAAVSWSAGYWGP